jgi:hypothetical protein
MTGFGLPPAAGPDVLAAALYAEHITRSRHVEATSNDFQLVQVAILAQKSRIGQYVGFWRRSVNASFSTKPTV